MIRHLRVGICRRPGATSWRRATGCGRGGRAEDAWPALANDIFKGRPLADGAGLVGLEMPVRAEDAAIVPVTMRITLPPATHAISRR